MALKQILTSDEYGVLADPVKEHYVQDGDSYKLETDFVPENVDGLKSALEKERQERKSLAEQIKKYKDIDPDKAREAFTRLKELEEKELLEAKNFEELKERLKQEKDNEINSVKTDLTTKLTRTEEKLKQVLITKAIIAEAAKKEAYEDSLEVFADIASKFVTLEIGDDDIEVKVADGKGSNIAELVSNLADTPQFGVFFKAGVSAGSGSSANRTGGGGGGSARPTTKKASEMTSSEKAKYINENGLQAWTKLLAAG
ncbi:MAG: hypothetical protein ACK4S4_15785 [Pyrinomonadaceae bacterium]